MPNGTFETTWGGVEAEPEHVGLHDADPTTEGPSEPGDPTRVELDSGDWVGTDGEQPRQRTVTGAELQDRAGRHQRGDAGDDAPIDEEVLTELMTAANAAAGGRGHG